VAAHKCPCAGTPDMWRRCTPPAFLPDGTQPQWTGHGTTPWLAALGCAMACHPRGWRTHRHERPWLTDRPPTMQKAFPSAIDVPCVKAWGVLIRGCSRTDLGDGWAHAGEAFVRGCRSHGAFR
jgi:hypothetical protein